MKKILAYLLICIALCSPAFAENFQAPSVNTLQHAIESKANKIQVQGQGVVMKILRDDTQGDKHQKFILRTAEGNQLLIVHNIDIAERIENLKRGDTIEFSGEYIWNDKGGLIHWTHHDPHNHHPLGWIKHKGRLYQ